MGLLNMGSSAILCYVHNILYAPLKQTVISIYRHVGILYIKSDLTFKIDPIPLQCVRPFIIEGVRLRDTGIHHQDEPAVEKYLAEKVAGMIDRVTAENEGNDKLPLVRLKVRGKCSKNHLYTI